MRHVPSWTLLSQPSLKKQDSRQQAAYDEQQQSLLGVMRQLVMHTGANWYRLCTSAFLQTENTASNTLIDSSLFSQHRYCKASLTICAKDSVAGRSTTPHARAAVCMCDPINTREMRLVDYACAEVSNRAQCRHVTHWFSKELYSTHVVKDIQHPRRKQPETDSASTVVLVWVISSCLARRQQWTHVKPASKACSASFA